MKKMMRSMLVAIFVMAMLLETGSVSLASSFPANGKDGEKIWVDFLICDSNTFFIPYENEDSATLGTYYKTIGGVVYRWSDYPDDTNYATAIAVCPEEKVESVTILGSLGEDVEVKYIELEKVYNTEEIIIQKDGGNVFVSDLGGSESLKRVKLQGDCSGVIFYEGCWNGCTNLESVTYMDTQEIKYVADGGSVYYISRDNGKKSLVGVLNTTLERYEVASDVIGVGEPFGHNETVKKLIIKGDLDWLRTGEMVKLKKIIIGENVEHIGYVSVTGATGLKKLDLSGISVEEFRAEGATSLREVNLPAGCKLLARTFQGCKNLREITFNDKKAVPKIKKGIFNNTRSGIKFYVKNKKVAKDLKKQLKRTAVKNAKIYVKGKLVYKNVNGR